MTILNRDQLHGIRQNIFKLGLCEKAKMLRLYIKTQQRNAVNKRRCLGTATQDKCEMTHASPGPISSLIKMEHKFSVSRTKILLLQRWFLTNGTSSHPPLSLLAGLTGSAHEPWLWECSAEITHLSTLSFNNCKNNWCLGFPEKWKLVHWWHPAINVIHYERLGATIDLYGIAFMD